MFEPQVMRYLHLCDGITDGGCDVWDIGLTTTPMVYFATVHLKVDASVQITASHNPAIYNGMKISKKVLSVEQTQVC